MPFFKNLVRTKVFHRTVGVAPSKWIHNDFMYVRFGGRRNTKTWSKSKPMDAKPLKCQVIIDGFQASLHNLCIVLEVTLHIVYIHTKHNLDPKDSYDSCTYTAQCETAT